MRYFLTLVLVAALAYILGTQHDQVDWSQVVHGIKGIAKSDNAPESRQAVLARPDSLVSPPSQKAQPRQPSLYTPSSSAVTPTATITPPQPTPNIQNPTGIFTVQVASFSTVLKAQELVDTLNAQEVNAYLGSDQDKQGRTWYRVYIGEYSTLYHARKKQIHIQSQFQQAFVRKL